MRKLPKLRALELTSPVAEEPRTDAHRPPSHAAHEQQTEQQSRTDRLHGATAGGARASGRKGQGARTRMTSGQWGVLTLTASLAKAIASEKPVKAGRVFLGTCCCHAPQLNVHEHYFGSLLVYKNVLAQSRRLPPSWSPATN
eukprot:6209744-Pleurochrysis_carterae.AAC.3